MTTEEFQLLFPLEILPEIKDIRTKTWKGFLENYQQGENTLVTTVALVITLTRLVGCATCEADSFRAMRGCVACAKQSLKRNKDSDDTIIDSFHQCERQVVQFLKVNDLEYELK